MIFQIAIGVVVACVTSVVVALALRQRLSPVLLSATLVATTVLSPFVVLLFESPLNIEALVFWVIPVFATIVLLPLLKGVVCADNWSLDKKQEGQKSAMFVFRCTLIVFSTGGLAFLFLGKESELAIFIAFASVLSIILLSIFGGFLFVLTKGKQRAKNGKGCRRLS